MSRAKSADKAVDRISRRVGDAVQSGDGESAIADLLQGVMDMLGLLVVETAALADAKIAESERRAAYDERLATSMEKALAEPEPPKPCPGCGHGSHRKSICLTPGPDGLRCACIVGDL